MTELNRKDKFTREDIYRILRRNNLVGRLRRRAFVLFILGCTGPFWMAIMSEIAPVSLIFQTIYIVFMFLCGITQLYWWFKLGHVYQYMNIPIIEAQKKMEALSKLRLRIKYTTWIIGAPVLIFLFREIWLIGGELYFYPALIGGVIGLSIGLTLEYLNRRQVRDIAASFDDFNDIEG